MEFNGKSPMIQLKVSDITVGMACAADVMNKNGQLLIPENTPIEAKHIRLLKAWGFTELPIHENSESAKTLSAVVNLPSNDELERRFRQNIPSLPAVIEMKKILASGQFLRDKE